MTSADQNWGDQLNDYLDARASGTTPTSGELDPAMDETVQRFFASDDAPAPPHGRASQIWEDLMNQSAYAGTIPQVPSIDAPPNRNGRMAPRTPWAPRPLPRPAPAHRSWRIAQLAVAALLLAALGFGGYRALDPFGSGPEQPSSIPAAVAPGASPIATAYPMTDHPFIGAWKWSVVGDPGCCGVGVADGDGTYVIYNSSPGVGIGTWRPTGERTVELSFTFQHVVPRDMFDPSQAMMGTEFSPGMEIWLISVTVDKTGNTATFKGRFEARDQNGKVVHTADAIDWTGVRLVPDPSTTATPEP